MNEIDLVIPMVFPQDLEWQREYARACGGGDAMRNVRYRSCGTEGLLIRCCQKYMPWLRTIHVLLASPSQAGFLGDISTFRNNDISRFRDSEGPAVRLVFHRDFIPEKYLPCFSSPCIEMFLHRIPGLSEHFIYANDDMFPLSPLDPEDFFRNTEGTGRLLPCQIIGEKPYPSAPNLFHKACQEGLNMIAQPFGKRYSSTYLKNGHSFAPYLKSTCEEVWRRHGAQILEHLCPLRRRADSYNQYLYAYYQHFAGIAIAHAPKEQYLGPGTATSNIAAVIRDPDCGILCLNDNGNIRDWEKRAAIVRKEIAEKIGAAVEQQHTRKDMKLHKDNPDMNKDTKIFICTHTDFECPVSNHVYEIADTRKLFTSTDSDGVDELFYSELRTYHHLAENVELPKNVGFCQYRKYYEFLDDVPDLEAIIREHGCITANPYRLKQSVYDQYARCFYFGDMDITKAILYETAPELYQTFKKMLSDDMLYVGNMFIMPRENFLELMQIIWNCLQHYLAIVGKDIKGRIEQHAQLYLKSKGRGAMIEHQYRFGGSLGERITSAYIMQHFKDPKTYAIHYTEAKARPYRKLF